MNWLRWFFGGWMSFTLGFLTVVEMEGKGRNGRDVPNELLRFGVGRPEGSAPCDGGAARGEDTSGREMVIVAEGALAE